VVCDSRHLQGCSPHLCRLSINGLAPASKYWTYWSHANDMGLVSQVVCHWQKLDLSPLLHWLAWERNWVWTHRSVSRRAVDCVGSPFSREQWDPSKSIGVSRKVAMHPRTKRGMCVVCWLGFPSRVYIDSNHHDSRIWVPLICGNHHVVTHELNLINAIVIVML
jgi:hypothetical protein